LSTKITYILREDRSSNNISTTTELIKQDHIHAKRRQKQQQGQQDHHLSNKITYSLRAEAATRSEKQSALVKQDHIHTEGRSSNKIRKTSAHVKQDYIHANG